MKQEISVLGIDIAKRVFHAVGMENRGPVVYRKRWSRHDRMPFSAKLPPVRIGIEACGGAHYWARRFWAYGHEVQLMAPQCVKPYVKSNKNDSRDAGWCPSIAWMKVRRSNVDRSRVEPGVQGGL